MSIWPRNPSCREGKRGVVCQRSPEKRLYPGTKQSNRDCRWAGFACEATGLPTAFASKGKPTDPFQDLQFIPLKYMLVGESYESRPSTNCCKCRNNGRL